MRLSRTTVIITGVALVLAGVGLELAVLAGLEQGAIRVGTLAGAVLNRLVTVLTVMGSCFVVAGLVRADETKSGPPERR
ncbi:hypothetical protein [Cellulomonas sp. IC4_254]|uniref:hypothetical protein n=1 Tax=Cellulomonas sp. IC4_254 TaxID=2714040 RepID=UPI00141E4283|nr:hypothetical protein [Cellulomonas sp. IC4_254]NHT18220.1 hypothetical protein [Cellulomonas sp. IC4_254]